MTEALAQLRKQMERGELVVDSPCIVHIPWRFFMIKTSGAPGVRILDLPGDNPANMEEQKHVNQMAKTYLPFADLVSYRDDLFLLSAVGEDADSQRSGFRYRAVTSAPY